MENIEFELARDAQLKRVVHTGSDAVACTWCGARLTGETRATCGTHPETNRICRKCDSLRDMMRSRIRHSGALALYAARAEAREAPRRIEREERAKQEAEKPVQEKPVVAAPAPQLTPEDIARIVAGVMDELLK